MINIDDKFKCCGCNACVQRCPKQCIGMYEDEEGFLYPQVDTALCIDCGICEKVCPVTNQSVEKEPIAAFAMQHADKEVRLKSSSGGIFSLIATDVIKQGGVVFGARWNEKLELIHDYTETQEGLAPFRGSKYVQSYIGDTYKLAEEFLKGGRIVLFTGVPCQIAGLKRFLRKDYHTLLTIDVLCHGVPSPGFFRGYLAYLSRETKIIDFNFRDKSSGWKGYSVKYTLLTGKTKCHKARLDEYMRGFLNHYMLRLSCHKCPAKSGKSGSDITLGDLWDSNLIKNLNDDNTGLSVVVVNTPKGKTIIESLDLYAVELSLPFIKKHNAAYYVSTPCSSFREAFWKEFGANNYNSLKKFNALIGPTISNVRMQVFKERIVYWLQLIGLMKIYFYLKQYLR